MGKESESSAVEKKRFFRQHFTLPFLVLVVGSILGGLVVEYFKPLIAKTPSQADAEKLIDLTGKSLEIVDHLIQSGQQAANADIQNLKIILTEVQLQSGIVSKAVRNYEMSYSANKNFSFEADFFLQVGGAIMLGSGDISFGLNGVDDKDDNHILVKQNGHDRWIRPGDRWDFESAGRGKCYLAYLGKVPGSNYYGFVSRQVQQQKS